MFPDGHLMGFASEVSVAQVVEALEGPTHRTAIMARTQGNHAFALMVNRVAAGDGGLLFAGGSALLDPLGTLLSEAGREEGFWVAGAADSFELSRILCRLG